MPLTNEEFRRLDMARLALKRKTEDKGQFQLAIEHLEVVQPQLERAVKVIEVLINQRDKSVCWRARRWWEVRKARVKRVIAAWR